MTSFMYMSHLQLRNWYMKFKHLFSGALYVNENLKMCFSIGQLTFPEIFLSAAIFPSSFSVDEKNKKYTCCRLSY